MNNDAKVYEGGIPSQGFGGTYPKEEGAEPMFHPDPSKGEVDTEKGDPASFKGSSNLGFLGNESYDGPGDVFDGAQKAPAMKVVDLDDIKSTV